MNREGGARTSRVTRSAARGLYGNPPPTRRARTTSESGVESNVSDVSQKRRDHKKKVRVEKAKQAELSAVQEDEKMEDEELEDEPMVEKSPKKEGGLKKIKPTAAAIALMKKMGRSKPKATAAPPPGNQEQLQQEQEDATSSPPAAALGEAAEEQEEMYTDPKVLIADQLAAMANQNKENEPVKPKRRLIDRQEDATKVSQITDFDDSEGELPEPGNLGRRVVQQPKQRQQEEVSDDDDDFAAAPEVIFVAGTRRRGLPKSRVVPAPEEEQEEEEGPQAEAAREKENYRRIVEARDRNRKEVPVQHQVAHVQIDGAHSVARSESQASEALARYDPYNPPDFSLVNAAAKEGTRKGRAAKAQARRGWGAEETNTFQKLIVTRGTRWAQFDNEGALDKFGGRSQSQMKDKAMNMKADYMKAKIRLPANFEDISLRAKQKRDIREQAGIDPDNYEEELNKLGL